MFVPTLKYAGGISVDCRKIVITFPAVTLMPGPAPTPRYAFGLIEFWMSRYGEFCVIDFTAPAVDVVANDGAAAGPLRETRSRKLPVHCRGISVPCRRSESAMYSVFWNVTDFANPPWL